MATDTKKTKIEYVEAVGRRKTAVARVRMMPAAKMDYVVNDRELHVYFPTKELQETVKEAIGTAKLASKFKVSAHIAGGGPSAQAEALRHGISRIIVKMEEELRKTLKKVGFLKRDPRTKERRKFGLKKARKAPQWSKR